jgi:V8-like Glu-specific endopeptidase
MTALALTACGSRNNAAIEKSEVAAAFMDCRPEESNGIVNGTSVAPQDPDSKRAVLLIIRRGKTISSCTGAPISDRVILTAGHCLKGVNKRDVTVVFHPEMTCTSGYNESKSIPSVDVLVHKDYKGDNQAKYDLAMVKLESPIPSTYHPQSLYDGTTPLSSDQVLMIGYGVTSEKTRDSMHLRKTMKSFKTETAVRDQNIGFDQRAGGGVCSGDSGGPVYVQADGEYKIIAVNSTVMSKDENKVCHGLSMAMYMPYFADWVQQSLKKLK